MECDWNSVFEGGGDDESGKYANERQAAARATLSVSLSFPIRQPVKGFAPYQTPTTLCLVENTFTLKVKVGQVRDGD